MSKLKVILLTIILTIIFTTPVYAITGIDVSSYQGTIDWKSVKSDGISFAFIRCKSAVTGEDTMFDYNMYEATQQGIPVGVYYYSGATTDEEIVAETLYMLEVVEPYKISLPLVLDIEGPEQSKLSQERLQRNIILFSKLVKDAGYTPMVYSNSNFFKNKIGDISVLKWEANYGHEMPTTTQYWQYSSKGTVRGISGRVDMNKFLTSSISVNKIQSK